jgi:hypothetical protein
VLGRGAFNNEYHNVWVKRSLQTGEDRVKAHATAATDARNNADKFLDSRELHTSYLNLFGVKDLTPMSSWGSRTHPLPKP